MKRLTATLLTLALCLGLLTGCNKPGEESAEAGSEAPGANAAPAGTTAMGRYVEEDITPDTNGTPLALHINEDGSLEYYCQEQRGFYSPYFSKMGLRHFRLAAGGAEWVEQEIPWLDELCAIIPEVEGNDYSFMLDMDGADIYIAADRFYVNEDWTSVAEQTCFFRWDGATLHDLGWQLPTGGEYYATPMSLSDFRVAGGAAYVRTSGNAYLLPTAGEALSLELNPGNDTAAFLDGSLYLHTGEEVHVYDGATGSRTAGLPLENGKLAAGAGGLYLLGDSGRFLRYAADGSTEETLMQSTDYTFGKPLGFVSNIAVGASGTICLARGGDGATRLYRYTFDPDMPTRPENTITVYSLFSSNTILTAAHLWRAQNPETGIEYTIAFPDGTEYTPEQLETELTRLVLELVSGEGPDLLVLDGLPADSMIRQGVLQDLTGLVDTSGLFANIAGCYETDTGLYAVPTRMTFDAIGGPDAAAVHYPTLESFVQAALAAPADGEGKLVDFNSQRGMFEAFYPAWADSIWQGGALDADALAEFLTQTKQLADHYGMQAESPWGHSSDNSSTSGYMNNVSQVWVADAQFTSDLLQNNWRVGMDPRTAAVLPVAGPDGQGRIRPMCVVGLRTGADAGAAAFIQLLLEDGVQRTNVREHFAADEQSFRALVEAEAADLGIAMETDLAALAAGLVPAPVDATVQGIVWATAQQYYAGATELADAVRHIETAAGLYLAEQA